MIHSSSATTLIEGQDKLENVFVAIGWIAIFMAYALTTWSVIACSLAGYPDSALAEPNCLNILSMCFRGLSLMMLLAIKRSSQVFGISVSGLGFPLFRTCLTSAIL